MSLEEYDICDKYIKLVSYAVNLSRLSVCRIYHKLIPIKSYNLLANSA